MDNGDRRIKGDGAWVNDMDFHSIDTNNGD